MWFRKKKQKDAAEVVREMREQIFSLSAEHVGIAPGPGHTRVWGVVMEIGFPEAVASLIAIADGTTSLYFSNGGGVIGAGEHKRVRDAADRLIALTDGAVDALMPTDAHPLPAKGKARFYARTFDELRTGEGDVEALGEGRHPLSALFHAGHAVISAVREASPPANA